MKSDLINRLGFLKPTISKGIIFCVLMGGLNWLVIYGRQILDGRILLGVPYGFYPVGSELFGDPQKVLRFSIPMFIADCFFWYAIASAIAVTAFDQSRRVILLAMVPLAGAMLAVIPVFSKYARVDHIMILTVLVVAVVVGFYRGENATPSN